MAENIYLPEAKDKKEIYQAIVPQIQALVEGEDNLIANLANVSAALKMAMDFFWVGFYLVENNELVLGPFQGPVACTRIGFGKGVCGTAWKQKKTVIVPDVDQFPGHIACSSASRSEIVLPVLKNDQVKMVLDVDSDRLDHFDLVDQEYLMQVIKIIENKL